MVEGELQRPTPFALLQLIPHQLGDKLSREPRTFASPDCSCTPGHKNRPRNPIPFFIILIAVILLVVVAVWGFLLKRRSARLRGKFGLKYETAIHEYGVGAKRNPAKGRP